ncbi:MAG: hypothetical protein ACLRFN_03520 [Alphaproteobacteria bacterium]
MKIILVLGIINVEPDGNLARGCGGPVHPVQVYVMCHNPTIISCICTVSLLIPDLKVGGLTVIQQVFSPNAAESTMY